MPPSRSCSGSVRVQEAAALQVQLPRQTPTSDDEGGVAREPPLGTDVRPVDRAGGHVSIGPRRRGPDVGPGHPLTALERLPGSRQLQVGAQGTQVLAVRDGQIVDVVEIDAVRCGDVFRSQEPRIVGNRDAPGTQQLAHLRVVGHGGERAGAGISMLAPAGAAVQRAEIRIVVGDASVPAEDDEPAEAIGQADRPQSAFDDGGLLRRGEPSGTLAVGGVARLHRHASPHRVPEPAADARRHRSVELRRQRLAREPRGEEVAQHVHEHEGRDRALLHIVKEMIGQPAPARSRRVALQGVLLVRPYGFVYGMARRQQDRAQRVALPAVECLVIHGDAEETRVAEGFIRPLRLDVPAKRLGPHIDTEDELRAWPIVARRQHAAVPGQLREQALPVSVFVRFQPHSAVPLGGKRRQPAHDRGHIGR